MGQHTKETHHCLPNRTAAERRSKAKPYVRATGRWCCGPFRKLGSKKCQKACFSRRDKEDCVPFCEDPDHMIMDPVFECPPWRDCFLTVKTEARFECRRQASLEKESEWANAVRMKNQSYCRDVN